MEEQQELMQSKLQRDFDAWVHSEDGGKIANLFIRIAIGFHRRGQKVGARMIWERLRWISYVRRRRTGEDFAYNDHYPPYLARLAMARVPELEGFFETRKVKET